MNRADILDLYRYDEWANERIDRVVSFSFLGGRPGEHRLADLLVHVANHSTYHRGQVASMLRQAGFDPPATDFIVYRAEQPAGT